MFVKRLPVKAQTSLYRDTIRVSNSLDPDLSIQTRSAITVWKRLKFRKGNCMLYVFQEEDGSFCII